MTKGKLGWNAPRISRRPSVHCGKWANQGKIDNGNEDEFTTFLSHMLEKLMEEVTVLESQESLTQMVKTENVFKFWGRVDTEHDDLHHANRATFVFSTGWGCPFHTCPSWLLDKKSNPWVSNHEICLISTPNCKHCQQRVIGSSSVCKKITRVRKSLTQTRHIDTLTWAAKSKWY